MKIPYRIKFINAQWLARNFTYYQRGKTLTGTFNDIFQYAGYGSMFAVFLKVSWNINIGIEWIVLLATLSALINWILGLWDSKSGFYKIQNDFQAKEMTPFWKELSEKIDKIYEKTK